MGYSSVRSRTPSCSSKCDEQSVWSRSSRGADSEGRTRLAEVPEDDEELRFGNSVYYIQFDERKHKGMYGHRYRFFLTDAVEDVPEYLVNWDNFEA